VQQHAVAASVKLNFFPPGKTYTMKTVVASTFFYLGYNLLRTTFQEYNFL